MSGVYGPIALTANAATIGKQAVDPRAYLLYFDNDSPFDVLISTGAMAPRPQATSNGDNDWGAIIPAGHHRSVWIQPDDRFDSPLGYGGFQGNVYFYAVDPGGLINPGTVSSRANLTITTFYKGEQPPADYASPRAVDLASQPRIITLTPAPVGRNTGVWDMTVNAAITMTTTPFTATNKKTSYVHGLLVTTGSVGLADITMQIQQQSASGTGVATSTVLRGYVADRSPLLFIFPNPLPYGYDANATITTQTAYLLNFVRGTALALCSWSFWYDEDRTSAIAVPSYGGGILATATSTSNRQPGGGVLVT